MIDELLQAKTLKCYDIDKRTDELIEQGFSYNDKLFNCRPSDIQNYTGLYVMRNKITFPFTIKTKTDVEYYTFQELGDLENFAESVFIHVQSLHGSGWTLKEQVHAKTEISEVWGVIDNR
jgi:hypothetical protein